MVSQSAKSINSNVDQSFFPYCLKRILRETFHVRASRRYPGYWRVYSLEYRKALLRILRQDAADLVEMLDLKDILQDLQFRLDDPRRHSAAGKITRGILGHMDSQEVLRMKGREFNQEAERFYRNDLRIRPAIPGAMMKRLQPSSSPRVFRKHGHRTQHLPVKLLPRILH